MKKSENRAGSAGSSFVDMFIKSPIGIYIVQDGKFKFANPAFQRIAGYTEKELIGMASLRIVYPEDRERVRKSAAGMLKGRGSSPYIYRAVNKSGDIRWIIESVTSIQYKGRRAALGYFMDDTERERAKEALSASEKKFAKAFRSSPEWVVISTLKDGRYLDVNEAFLRITGYSRDEVIGRTSEELGIWADPNDRVKMVGMLREDGQVRNLEVRFRMKSGEIRFMLWSAEVIDFEGEKCLIALTRDITARRRAEEEKLKREKLQGVLETAGGACHELNQPLQYIYYLLNEVLREFPDEENIREIGKQVDRIRQITSKLESITLYETKNYIKGTKIVDIDRASGDEDH